jgi:hypothetical protein
MPNHGSSRQRTASPTRAVPPDHWRALVQLPGRVVVATAGTRSMTPSLAGLEAIAAGRYSSSPLVRHVVAAIYLEDADAVAGPSGDLLDACGRAGAALDRLRREDADAYRGWIEAIAARVWHAGNVDAIFDTGGPALTPTQLHLLAQLRAAFHR